MNITWLFNDLPIPYSLDVTTSTMNRRVSLLAIESVAAHHVGNYTCVGKNDAGNASHTSALFVNGSIISSEVHMFAHVFLVYLIFSFFCHFFLFSTHLMNVAFIREFECKLWSIIFPSLYQYFCKFPFIFIPLFLLKSGEKKQVKPQLSCTSCQIEGD